MTKLIAVVFLVISLNISYAKTPSSNPLPNWIDKTRETSDGLPPLHSKTLSAPPASFRLTAEYEKAKAVVLGYRGYTTMLKEIAKYAVTDGEAEVWAAYGPNSLPSVPADKYIKVPCSLNTVWIRDYGPFGIIESTGEVGVIDSIYRHYSYRRSDDQLPTCLANSQNIEPFAMNLILDGGNLMVDRHGNLFMTKRTYIWNNDKTKEEVDQILKDYFNVKTIHAIDYAGYPGSPTDGTGHIDMFVKLLNDETVLIAKSNEEPYKSTCEKAADYFKNLKTPTGGNYKIIRVKGIKNGRTWYTYTNSLIVNNVVMVPSYASYSENNEDVINAYQQGIPGIKVRMINSDSSITSGGAIHCITQLIPKIEIP